MRIEVYTHPDSDMAVLSEEANAVDAGFEGLRRRVMEIDETDWRHARRFLAQPVPADVEIPGCLKVRRADIEPFLREVGE